VKSLFAQRSPEMRELSASAFKVLALMPIHRSVSIPRLSTTCAMHAQTLRKSLRELALLDLVVRVDQAGHWRRVLDGKMGSPHLEATEIHEPSSLVAS
jgi:hypothetical protein